MPSRRHPNQLTSAEIPPDFIEASHENGINPVFAEDTLKLFAKELERENVLKNVQGSIELAEREGLDRGDIKLFTSFKNNEGVIKVQLQWLPIEAKHVFAKAIGIEVSKVETGQGLEVKTANASQQEELNYRYEHLRNYYTGIQNKDRLDATLKSERKIYVPTLPSQTSLLGIEERPKIGIKRSRKKIIAPEVKADYASDYLIYEGEAGEPNHAVSLAAKPELEAEAEWALDRRRQKLAAWLRRIPNSHDALYPDQKVKALPKQRKNETDEQFKRRLNAHQLETYAEQKIAQATGFTTIRRSELAATPEARQSLNQLAVEVWGDFLQRYDAKKQTEAELDKTPAQEQLSLDDAA